MTSFSVTNIRVAFECPRLFYLGHKLKGPTLFQPASTTPGVGKAFHSLCERSVEAMLRQDEFQQLLSPISPQLDNIKTQLKSLLYKHAFYPSLQEVMAKEPKRVTAYQKLWQGLDGLIEHWAKLLVQNRKYCSSVDVIRKTFLAQELNLQYDFELPDDEKQLVRGRFDSLIYDFTQQRLCVIDYKTYQAQDASATLTQVALYGYMLRDRIGLPINSAVYSVLPDWKEQHFTWDELEASVHQLIPPRLQQMRDWLQWQKGQSNPVPATAQASLCSICPQKSKCQETFGNTAETATSPTSDLVAVAPSKATQSKVTQSKAVQPKTAKAAATTVESDSPKTAVLEARNDTQSSVDAIANQLVTVLKAFNVGVDYAGAAIGPAFVRVKLKPHLGVRVSKVVKSAEDLRVQMGLENTPMIAAQAGYISVDLPRPDRQTAHFQDYVQPQEIPPTDPVKIAIGVDLNSNLLEADLSDPNTCHFLVGGTTGSGKSEFLRSMLLSLLVRHNPEHLKIVLVDPKRVTFPEFETIPWLYQPVVKDSEAAIDLMERLVDEMDRRYRRFEKAQCSSLKDYNKKAEPLPRIVCIFDEYADFMAEKDTAKALEQSIKRLGAMARAAGIHLIIATQRPEAKVVTPLIRSNLPGRVALRTASSADSGIILGGQQEEAAQLLGKGDLLYLGGAQSLRLQSLFAGNVEEVLPRLS